MKDAKDTNGKEITLKMLMEHMQYGFSRVNKRFDAIDLRFDAMDLRMDSMEKKMDAGFTDLLDRWRWMDSHELPKRVSQLEDKVFAGVDP